MADPIVIGISGGNSEDQNSNQPNASQTVETSHPQTSGTRKRQAMQLRSEVWSHFTKLVKNGRDIVGRCNYCEREIKADPKSNGTSGLKNHMRICKKQPSSESQQQSEINFKPVGDSEGGLAIWKFDQDCIRKALAKMIIVGELPFKFVEYEGFREFMSVACPRFRIPSRWTVSRDCLQLYVDEKVKLKQVFARHTQRICLTTDTWTSLQRVNYMCLTAHYIDDKWCLNKKILNFCPISDHSGKGLGMAIEMCLLEWGIDKVFTITVDNATNNNVAINYLRDKVIHWGTSIANGKYIHMRCIAHIINLIVVDGLKEVSSSILKIRAAVKYVRHSPSRLNKFKECVELEKIQSNNLLCLDVSTRWNSTYLMLDTAQKFERAFDRFKEIDSNFKKELVMEDGSDGVPSSRDWHDVRRMVKFLENFYDLTVHVSGSLYVTCNTFFDEISVVDRLLQELEKSDDFEMILMANSMRQKYNKYWGDSSKMNKLIYIAVVLDPRNKLEYLEMEFQIIHEKEKAVNLAKEVKEATYGLFLEYKNLSSPSQIVLQSNEGSSQQSSGGSSYMEDNSEGSFREAEMRRKRGQFKKYRSESGVLDTQTELDRYLGESTEEDSDNFNILTWWKVNSPRFPILSQMARDVLAIPISTVASESAFSTGGRILDAFRSSLSPKLVQALICAQDWFRKSC